MLIAAALRGRVRRSCAIAAALVLCGCGGAAKPPVKRSVASTASPLPLVAALGDSITAGSPLWDPDPQVRAEIGSPLNEQSQYEYWAAPRLHVQFRNCGVFGERTDQIAQRLEGCARGARYLILQGGINDIAQRRPVAAAARNLEAIAVRAQALGLRVELVQVLPWNNGYPAAARPIEQLNALIAQLAARRQIPVAPFYRALEDARAPARMQAGLTIDGNHPSVAGYRLLAGLITLPPVSSGRR